MNFFIFIEKENNPICSKIEKVCKERKMSEIHNKNSILYHKNRTYPADCVSLYFDTAYQTFLDYVEGMEEVSKNVFYNNMEGLEQKTYFIYFDEEILEEKLLELIKTNIKMVKK